MHYVLFIEREKLEGTSEEILTEVGCGHIVEGVQSPKRVNAGPTGKPGLLFSWMTNSGRIHHHIGDDPVWLPAIGNADHEPDRYWVGVKPNDPPTPKDMQRRYPHAGETHTLGQHTWIFPQAEKLPFDMIRQDDGSTQFIPQRRFHEFYLLSSEWKNTFLKSRPGGHVAYEEMRDFVEHGLTLNYRLIPEVADYLKLYTTGENGTVLPVLRAALSMTAPDQTEAV